MFAERVATILSAEAPALVERWQAQARSVAPRAAAAGRRAGDAVVAAATDGVVTQAIAALGCALRRTPRCQDDVLRAGWEFGGRAHDRGTSLHNMMKELDLLEAMILYVAERAAGGGGGVVVDPSLSTSAATPAAPEGPPPSGTEVMAAARRLHRSFAALRLAATKGFTHAYVEALRARYRTLRHDLRNPIGTIRSAVALMDDESLPAEVRFGQRYRAMVTRNATSLDALVGAALGDGEVNVPAMALQDVALGELALTVRRDLREDADAAGCTIELAPSLTAPTLPIVRVDSTAFELVLRSLVDAALGQSIAESVVTVGLRALLERQATVSVTYTPAVVATPRPVAAPPVPTLAAELAQRSGGRVWREDAATLLLEIPVDVRSAIDVRPGAQSASAAVTTVAGAGGTNAGRRSDAPVAVDSFGGADFGDAPASPADKLPRGGGPPDSEIAGAPGSLG